MQVDIYKTDMDNWYVTLKEPQGTLANMSQGLTITHGPFATEEIAERYLRCELDYRGPVKYFGPVKEPEPTPSKKDS